MRLAGSGTAADSGSAEGVREPLPVPPADQSFRHQDMRREWGYIPRNPDNFPFDREVSLPNCALRRSGGGPLLQEEQTIARPETDSGTLGLCRRPPASWRSSKKF